MKIGLLSDTHGHLDPKVFKYFESCDEIWHAGDIGSGVIEQLVDFKPTRAVFGNIDGQDVRIVCPEHAKFMCEDLKVWITHIGGYPPRYNAKIKKALQQSPPDIFICGHSHVLKIMRDPKINNLLYINPGAAGIHGFHKVKTLVRFEVIGRDIKDMQVIEMGSRASAQ